MAIHDPALFYVRERDRARRPVQKGGGHLAEDRR